MREAAESLLYELESQCLDVVLVPRPDDDTHGRCKIRVAQESNPDWYRDFCAEYESRRTRPRMRRHKLDTKIKRQHTVAALERFLAGKIESEYVDRLLPFIAERAKELGGGLKRDRQRCLRRTCEYPPRGTRALRCLAGSSECRTDQT